MSSKKNDSETTQKLADKPDLASDSKSAQPPSETGKPPQPPKSEADTPRKARFDLDALRLPQNFVETAGVEKRGAIRLGKPPKHSFFRVHAGLTFPTRLLEFGESKDTYLVAADLCDLLASLLRLVVLRVYVTLDGVVGVWPLAMPDPLRPNRWHTSALEIAQAAETRWIRMAANQAVGAYDYVIALGDLKEPSWPTASLEEIIREAFKDRFIEHAEHPVLRALRGEL